MYNSSKEDSTLPTSNFKIQVAERVKSFRKHKGLSVLELSTILEKGTPAVYAIEQGRVFPQLDDLAVLKGHFGLNLNWIISGEGEAVTDYGKDKLSPDGLKGLIADLRMDPSNKELATKVDQQLTLVLDELKMLDKIRKIVQER